jgi:hypothetical protein
MLTNNKVSKYILYALGEILLVVIGILIALQVNNWNEDRKDRFREQKILESIYDDINTDKKNIRSMMENERRNIGLNHQLISILKDPSSEYENSMDSLFGQINRYSVFYPQRIGYESLKSAGLDILKNDNLKAAIVDLYDYQYGLIAETLDLKKQLYISSNTIFLQYLETDVEIEDLKANLKRPHNFEALKNEEIFFNHLTNIYYERVNYLGFAESTVEKIENVLMNINDELNAVNND